MANFRDATPDQVNKRSIFAPSSALHPLPLLSPALAGQYAIENHNKVFGNIPSLGVYEFEGALAGPSGTVWNQQFEIYNGSDIILSQWAHDEFERSIVRAHEADPIHRMKCGKQRVIKFDGNIVHAVRPGWQVYGHWLLDILPPIWLHKQIEQSNEIDVSESKFLFPKGLPSWSWGILHFLSDIKQEDCIFFNETEEVFMPNKIYLFSNMRIDNVFSPIMNKLIDEIVNKSEKVRSNYNYHELPRRIFIYRGSRHSFMQRSILNEDELVDIARGYGFIPIDPSKLTWVDQVRLFANADAVIGAFGSGMHNTIFSKPVTKSLILTNSQMNWIQSGISALRQQRMLYMWPSEESNNSDGYSMLYDPNLFKQAIGYLI